MHQLGYDMAPAEFTRRLTLIGADHVFVAAEGDVCYGLMALHIAPVLQISHLLARIMTLVVDAGARGRGIGRLLTDHAVAWAHSRGCDILEVTTGTQRKQAQAFYAAAGFTLGAVRFSMDLTRPPSG